MPSLKEGRHLLTGLHWHPLTQILIYSLFISLTVVRRFGQINQVGFHQLLLIRLLGLQLGRLPVLAHHLQVKAKIGQRPTDPTLSRQLTLAIDAPS